jgi:hypothetical protein
MATAIAATQTIPVVMANIVLVTERRYRRFLRMTHPRFRGKETQNAERGDVRVIVTEQAPESGQVFWRVGHDFDLVRRKRVTPSN